MKAVENKRFDRKFESYFFKLIENKWPKYFEELQALLLTTIEEYEIIDGNNNANNQTEMTSFEREERRQYRDTYEPEDLVFMQQAGTLLMRQGLIKITPKKPLSDEVYIINVKIRRINNAIEERVFKEMPKDGSFEDFKKLVITKIVQLQFQAIELLCANEDFENGSFEFFFRYSNLKNAVVDCLEGVVLYGANIQGLKIKGNYEGSYLADAFSGLNSIKFSEKKDTHYRYSDWLTLCQRNSSLVYAIEKKDQTIEQLEKRVKQLEQELSNNKESETQAAIKGGFFANSAVEDDSSDKTELTSKRKMQEPPEGERDAKDRSYG
jgi:hypothetical protein